MVAPRPFSDEPLAEAKRRLRRELRERRAGLSPAARSAASAAAAARFVAALPAGDRGPVAAFASLPDELDTAPLLAALAARGRPILLPRQVGRGLPLALHLWAPGDPLLPGPFGVPEPSPAAPVLRPAALAVPLLGWDRRGHRLGYGAGFYDRTLAGLRAAGPGPLAIGLAFDVQEVAGGVPAGDHDEPLDLIVTEARTVAPGRGAPGAVGGAASAGRAGAGGMPCVS